MRRPFSKQALDLRICMGAVPSARRGGGKPLPKSGIGALSCQKSRFWVARAAAGTSIGGDLAHKTPEVFGLLIAPLRFYAHLSTTSRAVRVVACNLIICTRKHQRLHQCARWRLH